MKKQLADIRTAYEALRSHIRPEADHLAGAMGVALDQADTAADEYDFDDEEVELATAAPAKKTTKRGK